MKKIKIPKFAKDSRLPTKLHPLIVELEPVKKSKKKIN